MEDAKERLTILIIIGPRRSAKSSSSREGVGSSSQVFDAR